MELRWFPGQKIPLLVRAGIVTYPVVLFSWHRTLCLICLVIIWFFMVICSSAFHKDVNERGHGVKDLVRVYWR